MTSKSVQRRVAIQRGGKKMSECFSKTEFDFLDRDIATDDGNLVKALREVRSLKAERDRLANELRAAQSVVNTTIRERNLAEAKCAEMPEQIRKQIINEVASGRTINNFGHVPEVVRALEWVLMDIQGLKLKDNPGQALLDYVAKLARVRDAAQSLYDTPSPRVIHGQWVELGEALATCPKEGK